MFVFWDFPQGFFPQLFIAAVVVPGREHGDVGEMGQLFDDRIEVLNSGELYGNNKLEKLGTYLKMEVRNNAIIRLLDETTDILENRHT